MTNQKEIADKLIVQKSPEWLIEMRNEYVRTGVLRGKHLRRLIGKPTVRVEIGRKASVSHFRQISE